MYTWGYIKNVALAKLDLELEEAQELKLINKFAYYANEVITQISSSIKPRHEFFNIDIKQSDVGKVLSISDPMFIGFGDDVSTIETVDFLGNRWLEECHDDDIIYKGYNNFICFNIGKYSISYKSRWYDFTNAKENTDLSFIPTDILDCIPSYIAHQCYKIDDEYKSSVFRNEYEMFLARIDDTNYNNTKTFKIEGDW